MPKTNTKESVSDLEASVRALSLKEHRQQTLLEIEELRLEDELAELEETRNELLRKRELCNKSKKTSTNRFDDGNRKTEMLTQRDFTLVLPLEMAGTGYSSYGCS